MVILYILLISTFYNKSNSAVTSNAAELSNSFLGNSIEMQPMKSDDFSTMITSDADFSSSLNNGWTEAHTDYFVKTVNAQLASEGSSHSFASDRGILVINDTKHGSHFADLAHEGYGRFADAYTIFAALVKAENADYFASKTFETGDLRALHSSDVIATFDLVANRLIEAYQMEQAEQNRAKEMQVRADAIRLENKKANKAAKLQKAQALAKQQSVIEQQRLDAQRQAEDNANAAKLAAEQKKKELDQMQAVETFSENLRKLKEMRDTITFTPISLLTDEEKACLDRLPSVEFEPITLFSDQLHTEYSPEFVKKKDAKKINSKNVNDAISRLPNDVEFTPIDIITG